jgi:hypothetical protein
LPIARDRDGREAGRADKPERRSTLGGGKPTKCCMASSDEGERLYPKLRRFIDDHPINQTYVIGYTEDFPL